MSESFYGGPMGQSFEVKLVFTSYHGSTNSIDNDIAKGWTSPISVGEFVVISYGEPGTTDYETYRNIDLNSTEAKAHNGTIWVKTYDEDTGNASGLSYKLITSLTGNTPLISVTVPARILDADLEPAVEYDNSNTDKPNITFELPKSLILSYDKDSDFTKLNANEDPDFLLDSSDINYPRIKVSLPVSLVINTAVLEESLDVGSIPEVSLDISESGTVNNPVLKFKLPVSLQLLTENITSDTVDANVEPSITFDDTNVNTPSLVFHLPVSQVMLEPVAVEIGPDESIAVEDIGTVNNPQLLFSLPRAVKFYYGSLLGLRTDTVYTLTNSVFTDYAVGDYYINASTGFLYKVTSKTDDVTCVFEYLACIISPLPSVETTTISPYTTEGEAAQVSITRNFIDNEQSAWQLNFSLPKAPLPQLETTFVGSKESGSAELTIADEDSYKISLTIPTGSKIFAGTTISVDSTSTTIDGSRIGDIYVNTSTGIVYELTSTGWTAAEDSLKGPVGEALNIVLYRTYSASDGITKDLIANLLVTEMEEEGLTPSTEDIISVVYTNDSDEEESFWYVWAKTKGSTEYTWLPISLTGGIGSVLQSSYTTDTTVVGEKTYTVAYINSLIGDGGDTEKDRTTYSKTLIEEMLSWGSISDIK